MTDIRESQFDIGLVTSAATNLRLSMADIDVMYRFPTAEIFVSALDISLVENTPTLEIDVSQGDIDVVCLGRVKDPVVRAWTFTLDGHDFYVLRLGDAETLIFDAATEQWVNWDGFGLPVWRVFCGLAWINGQSVGFEFNSNIFAGDDQTGLLWVLDPKQPYDEAVSSQSSTQQVPFRRIVTGQVPMIGREVVPCNAVFLLGDSFGLSTQTFTASVTLEYSDNAGKNYVIAGSIDVNIATVDQPYHWRSLGQIEAPGRLFRITDTGVFTRIDSLTMNDPQ